MSPPRNSTVTGTNFNPHTDPKRRNAQRHWQTNGQTNR